jgi:DNA primase
MKDPAEILQHNGIEALHKRAKCFITDFEYLVRRSRSLFDISASEGKARAVAFLFPYLETLDSEVSRDTCIGDMADAFGVERQAVLNDFRRQGARIHNPGYGQEFNQTAAQGIGPHAGAASIKMNDELFLLVTVLVNQELVSKLRSTLSIEELYDPRAKELFIALEEWFRNETPGMDDLLSRIHDEVLRNFVIEQGASKAFSTDPEVLFADSIKRVKQKRLERRQAEIISELRSQGREVAGRRLDELLTEKVHIDTELRKFKEANG